MSRKTHTHQISADHHTKEDGSKEELLILQDNMDGQGHKQYQDMCRDVDNTICWYFHPEYAYYLDPPDVGAGNNIMFWFRVYLDEWICYCGNVELRYLGILPPSHQQILITHLLIKSWI